MNRVVTPSLDHQPANKGYVDNKVVSATPDATSAVKGVAKLGKIPMASTTPSLQVGQLFYNSTDKILLLRVS